MPFQERFIQKPLRKAENKAEGQPDLESAVKKAKENIALLENLKVTKDYKTQNHEDAALIKKISGLINQQEEEVNKIPKSVFEIARREYQIEQEKIGQAKDKIKRAIEMLVPKVVELAKDIITLAKRKTNPKEELTDFQWKGRIELLQRSYKSITTVVDRVTDETMALGMKRGDIYLYDTLLKKLESSLKEFGGIGSWEEAKSNKTIKAVYDIWQSVEGMPVGK